LKDLTNVSGCGEKKVERFTPNITVGWEVMRDQPEPPESSADDYLVNINTANAERLKTLSGVGQATAETIIKYREENGPFLTIEDIMNVPRVSQGRFDKWKDQITVGEATSPAAKKSLTKPAKAAKLNLNQATAEQLMELPGIGQQTASTILAFRAKKKRFTSIDDLLSIPGFGKIKLERIRPLIEVK
jgi:competence ComEA-like helix-hairpin-helix protein